MAKARELAKTVQVMVSLTEHHTPNKLHED